MTAEGGGSIHVEYRFQEPKEKWGWIIAQEVRLRKGPPKV